MRSKRSLLLMLLALLVSPPSLGRADWVADGNALCAAANGQSLPVIVSDAAGGGIVAWTDYRSGDQDIYAQRVDAVGTPLWTANGVALCTAADLQLLPVIVSDGAGGAIVTWYDVRSGDADIYAQRVDAVGTPLWTANGAALCTASGNQAEPTIAPDGAGGAIVTWYDERSGTFDIYVQRVDAAGTPLWTADGVALCTAAGVQLLPDIVPDGAGGAVIVWNDERSGTSSDLYAQRVDGSGAPQWMMNGVPLCAAVGDQSRLDIAADGAGGAIVTWKDLRSGTDDDVYLQWVDGSGAPQWTADGVPLCTAVGDQSRPDIVADGAGGAIVTWEDFRSGDADIYAQRVDASGVPQWTAGGVVVSSAADDQWIPKITADGSGGAVFAWRDERNAAPDIYVQRVEPTYGYWGRPAPTLVSVSDVPKDQGGKVALNWAASGRDIPIPATVDFYSVWRAVDEASLAPSKGGAAAMTSLDQVRPETPPGRLLVESSYYWELVGTQTAYRWEHYSFAAATRADSVDGDPGETFFMVAAHDEGDEHIAFASNTLSGHSVDNLAPTAPFSLTAERVGPDVFLAWNGVPAPDLRDYALYRATESGVTPVPTNFLTASTDTVAVDAGAPGEALYYIVTAYDFHVNQSEPSNEASVSATTEIGEESPLVRRLTVLQNNPNPFAGSTEFSIGLPSASAVSLEIYDMAGRRVNGIQMEGAEGWNRVPFAARDISGRDLPSGVYFYRVRAGGVSLMRKMILAR